MAMQIYRRTLARTWTILVACLAWSAHGQTPPQPAPTDIPVSESPQPPAQSTTLPPPTGPVELEVFQGPKPLKMTPPSYPKDEVSSGIEGWVQLNFMVDPNGKPYEISVMESTGVKAFDKAAIRMIERSTFEPARLSGRAIDSGTLLKVIFTMYTPELSARREFVAAFKDFNKALQSGDRAKADASFAELKVRNLYEDAYYNLGKFQYAHQWGTEAQQIDALKAAIAGEKSPRYLEKKTFIGVLNSLLTLQIKGQDAGGALKTWERLKAVDLKGSAQWQPTIDNLGTLQKTKATIRTPGRIQESGHAFATLFKNRFSIEVTSGSISDLKLRCEKQYLIFRYQPDLQYSIDGRNSDCTLELVGEPGTAFALVQS